MDTETKTRAEVAAETLRAVGLALMTGAFVAAVVVLISLAADKPVIAGFAPMMFALGAGFVLIGGQGPSR